MVKVETLRLFGRDIDVYATVDKAKKFLNGELQNDLDLCSPRRTDLSSPLLDPTGVANHTGVNGIEKKVIFGVNASNHVKAVFDAINSLPNSSEEPYKKMLTLKYILNKKHQEVMYAVNYHDSQYFRMLRHALVLFATQMESFKDQDNATDIESMVVVANSPVSVDT